MNIFQAVVLGIVEGITEFLPISSTGHMILVSHLLQIPQSEFVKSFEIFIQLGAIAAVGLMYGRKLAKQPTMLKRIVIAFVPTGIVGLVLYRFIKTYLLGSVDITILALFLGGIAILVLEKHFSKKAASKDSLVLTLEDLPYFRCFAIGLAQSVAVVPGVSRSAATILGGMAVGLSRVEATEFSFLVATPTLLMAAAWDLLKTGVSFSGSEWSLLLVGFVVAFFTAAGVVWWLLRYVKSHTLALFGVYRIVLAGVLFILRGWFL